MFANNTNFYNTHKKTDVLFKALKLGCVKQYGKKFSQNTGKQVLP